VRQGRGWGPGAEGATRRRGVGQSPGPTGMQRAAGTSPIAAARAGGARSTPRQRKAGVADGWPLRYSGGQRNRESDADAWAPQHSTGGG
jgi:hypothetical protein